MMYYDDEKKVLYRDKVNDLFKVWEAKVNSFSYDPKKDVLGICSDEGNKLLYTHLALEWINFHIVNTVAIDGRNAYAMRMIRMVADTEEYQNLYFEYFSKAKTEPTGYNLVAFQFCKNAPRMHRTLMQSLTSFMLCVLANVSEELNTAMTEKTCVDWWKLPLI